MTATDPREPMHPQVAALFALLRAGATTERVLEAGPLRAGMEAFGALLNAGAPEVAQEQELRIPGPGGAIRLRVFHPEAPRPGRTDGPGLPVLVYLHGGGWVILSPETHAKLTRSLALAARAIVVSVDYRLAPEHPFPAPLDDCLAAFRWARANARSLGGDPRRVALAGDSAGGNLTAATTRRLLAAGEPPPAAAALLCPVADLELALSSPSSLRFGPGDPILDDALMRFFCESYAAREQWTSPDVSPLRGDVSGFPPSCLVVGGIDPLLDDGLALHGVLARAGRDVTLLRYDGMPHDFFLFPGLDAGARCVADVGRWLRARFSPASGASR
jgi:acetyl esterase